MELSALIKKIGHSLVEIRVRALKSVLSKLDHSLISVHDIVQEKMLFVFLLEWFNFPEVPMSNEVLELLRTLSKHPSSAQMLRDVGAVDFLTQLSPNVELRQRAVIEGTLEQLFMLPDLLPSQTDVYSHGPHNAALTAPAVVLPEENSSEPGYFHKNTSSDEFVPIQTISESESVRCLKFSVFPWLTLTNTDRHILSSNESSLGSNNPNLVRTTCELLCDVILQDFPAEIFLQRPNIAKKLLSLLKLSTGTGTGTGTGEGVAKYLHLSALSCLRQLCVELRKRLRFHQDPSFYSSKQDQFSQNSSFSCPQEVLGAQRSQSSSPGAEYSPRPSVVGRTGQRARGDGQDGDVASNSGSSQRLGAADQALTPADVAPAELPDLGVENVLELQFQQLTLAQFSVATVEHAIPILKTEGLHVFQRALELLSDALLLLCESVSELVWDDHSLVGTELREKLRACLELLGDILCSHQSHSADISHIHQRMTYIGTAVFTLKLLQSVLPPEKASEHLPESTAKAIFHLCLDSSLGSLLPSMQETAAAYLEQVNPDNHDLYRRVTRAALWMESTCNFMKEVQAQGEKNWLELLELADQSIDGLPFHQHLPVIQHCVNMCSYLWKFDQPSPLLQTESQKLLLKLLSHPLLPVRVETYECTLSLVKDCLGIHNVSRQTQEVCAGVHFLLHHKVLYEIITFGLQDASEKVNVPAKDILLFLLQGRLMMTPSTWDRFTQALGPVMAVLQGYTSTDESLGSCVLLISDTSAEAKDDGFPRLAKLKASLRLLFSSQPRVRIAAVQQIVPHLKSSDTGARPEVDQPVISSLSNIYCLTNPVDVSLGTSSKSVFKVESVEKLFSILQSDTVDLSLRRSAADQLAVVLQDTSMHLVLKNLGITDRVISFIERSVNGDQSCDCLLEPSVCILRKLVYVDPSLRHSLAQRDLLLLTLLRASVILKQNKANPSETAALMTLLLFDEMARIERWSDQSNTDVKLKPFSLPLAIIRRYNLPFQAATHHAVSPHCSVLPPSSDLQTLGPARQALQVAWNTAWFCGTEKLLEHLGCGNGDITEFHADLKLSEAQVCSLKAVHLPTVLQDCVQAIVRAAAHRSVAAVLSRLGLYLLIDRMVRPHTPTYSCKDVLPSLGWQTALTRFLQVRPACVEDEKLLVGIVAFLNAYFKHFYTELESDKEDGDLRWILELLLNQEGVSLLNLLLGVETQTSTHGLGEQEEQKNHISQRLQRELTAFFNTLLTCVTRTTDRMCLALGGPFKSQLAVRLLQSLRVSDAPRFYGLPSLERTLRGMVVLTAQPGWSSHCSDLEPSSLCSKYLSGLLEVISSFYVEWGENSLSFMGKGVTKNAIICLLHLSHEMMTVNKDKGENVISQWSLGNEAAAEETNASHLGLAWLVPLWVDRDPEVRFASLGLGAALSSISSGCQALCASCQNISSGLWGTLLNILLDQQESSLVRTEAAFILQNLLVMPMPANAEEAKNSHWQHPCVHDEVSGVSLVGLPALQALLYHCHYFQHMLLSASSCYCSWYGFHFQPGADVGTGPSPQGSSSLDSETSLTFPTYAEPLTLSSSRPSTSLSTSSTVIRGSGPPTPKAPSPSTITEATPTSRLMAQGQSETDTSDSVTSQDSCQDKSLAPGPVVIATPHLLTAHCGLLSNLLAVLPDFTLTAIRDNQLLQALARLVDFKAMEKCVTKMKTPSVLPGEKEDISSQLVTMLRFSSSFCKLLQSCVTVMSDETVTHMDFFNPLLSSLVAVLTLNTQGLDTGSQHVVCACWTDVFTLLAAVVKRDGSAAHPSVSAALGKRWRAFAGTLTLCLEEKLSDSRLHSAALKFISTVFTEETKRRNKEVTTSSLSDVLIGPPAAQLCDLLLQSFEKLSLQDPLKKLTAKALMTLMACSPTAQDFAATTGLIDSCVEQMKQIHSQLNLTSLRPSKASQRKKEEGYLKDARMTMEILRSALYCNDECKAAATDAHLTLALYALWPWLLLHDPTMEAALELLCVYTAHCTTACSALCGSGPAVVSGSKSSSTSSLMQSVMKLTSGFTADYTPIHNLAFSLLTNLVQSRDCRGLLQKNNFLQAFLSVPMPKAAAVKAQFVGSSGGGGGGVGGSLSAWLKLLVSVSLSEDGQQSILKGTGALELLLDLALHRRHALLTLHNLCFSTTNKSHLIANGSAIKVLLGSLENKEMETRCMGASALWALLHNNQRAKNALKCPTVRLQIEEALTVSKQDAEKKPGALSSYLIKCLVNLSQLLKD